MPVMTSTVPLPESAHVDIKYMVLVLNGLFEKGPTLGWEIAECSPFALAALKVIRLLSNLHYAPALYFIEIRGGGLCQHTQK